MKYPRENRLGHEMLAALRVEFLAGVIQIKGDGRRRDVKLDGDILGAIPFRKPEDAFTFAS